MHSKLRMTWAAWGYSCVRE